MERRRAKKWEKMELDAPAGVSDYILILALALARIDWRYILKLIAKPPLDFNFKISWPGAFVKLLIGKRRNSKTRVDPDRLT